MSFSVNNFLTARDDPKAHIAEHIKNGFRLGSDLLMLAPLAGRVAPGKMPLFRSLAISGLTSRVIVGTLHDLMPEPKE